MYRKFLQDTLQTERKGDGGWGRKVVEKISFLFYLCIFDSRNVLLHSLYNCFRERRSGRSLHRKYFPTWALGSLWEAPCSRMRSAFSYANSVPWETWENSNPLLSNLLTVTMTPDWPRACGLQGRTGNPSTSQVPTPRSSPDRSESCNSLLSQRQACWDMLGRKILQSQVSPQHFRFAPSRPGSMLSPF